MATYIGIGFSQDPHSAKAAREATLQARNQTKQSAQLVIVLTTIHYSPLETLHTVKQIFPEAQIMGCSTEGIILAESIETRGVAILAINAQGLQFGMASANNISPADMELAGTTLVRTAAMDFGNIDQKLLFLLTDGLLKDNSILTNSIKKIITDRLPFFGAGTSGEVAPNKTYQYFQEKLLSNSAVGFLAGGNVQLNLVSRHGWKPLGKPRLITKSQGHTIKKIDNKKAFHMYEEYFGGEAGKIFSSKNSLISKLYPLGIYIEKENRYLLRNVTEVFPDGSLSCQGDVPQDSEVFLMIGNKEFCKDAAIEAATETRLSTGDRQPNLIMILESVHRHKLLGPGAALQEIQSVRELVGQAAPIFGMYCYEEICPFKLSNSVGESYIQNNSFSILSLSVV